MRRRSVKFRTRPNPRANRKRPVRSMKRNKNKLITMNNIIVFGPPGAGKGTMCKMLKEEFGFEHLSTGDIIREHQANGTEVGKMADEIINEGNLLPDDIVLRMVKEKIESLDNEVGVLFDGFPRTKEQAIAFDEMLWNIGGSVNQVINIEVPFEITKERILKRAEKENRPDDNEDAIKVRMAAYQMSTLHVLKHYRMRNKVVDVDGSGTMEEEYANIKKALTEETVSYEKN